MTELTQERVRELLHYNPETGIFTRVKPIKGYKPGMIAGGKALNGYIQIVVDGHKTYAHRLAFFWMTGTWPPNDVDHINGDRDDNRWANLRQATRAENMWNVVPRYFGVYRYGKSRWASKIRVNSQTYTFGPFETEKEARDAYLAAALNLRGAIPHRQAKAEQCQ